LEWSNARTGEVLSTVGYQAEARDPEYAAMRLVYAIRATGERLDYWVSLATTRPRFGGVRWWIVCPLVRKGVPCGRRVGKLYLRGRYFGCRHCHELTYRSAQQHDKRVDFLRRNPAALAALMENLDAASVGQLGLVLKALRWPPHP
jgi:hypothetical protein